MKKFINYSPIIRGNPKGLPLQLCYLINFDNIEFHDNIKNII